MHCVDTINYKSLTSFLQGILGIKLPFLFSQYSITSKFEHDKCNQIKELVQTTFRVKEVLHYFLL